MHNSVNIGGAKQSKEIGLFVDSSVYSFPVRRHILFRRIVQGTAIKDGIDNEPTVYLENIYPISIFLVSWSHENIFLALNTRMSHDRLPGFLGPETSAK